MKISFSDYQRNLMRAIRTKALLWLTTLMLLNSGCWLMEPKSVDDLPSDFRESVFFSVYNPNKKLPSSGTFSWISDGIRIYADDRFDIVEFRQLLRQNVEDTLMQKGFVPSTSGPGTVQVGCVAALEETLDDLEINQFYGFNTGWSPGGRSPQKYEKGMMILDIVDGRTGMSLYRGAVRANMDPDLPEKIRKERLELVVAQLLSGFPR